MSGVSAQSISVGGVTFTAKGLVGVGGHSEFRIRNTQILQQCGETSAVFRQIKRLK